MSRCGRCRGRGRVKRSIGFGDMPCPNCKGTGVRKPQSALGRHKVSIPVPPGAWCAVCADRPAIEMHHLVPQQRIERYVAPERQRRAKEDPRNGVPACYACHKGLDDEATQLHPNQLPRGFWQFVTEYDLVAGLPRHLQGLRGGRDTSSRQEAVVSRRRSPREEDPCS